MIDKIKPINVEATLQWERDIYIEKVDQSFPSISVVIPIFNAGKFLEKTLRSLLCNDLSGVQIILMDGGSTDDTMEIVNHYKEIFSHVQSQKDKGQSDAINNGFQIASGEILYWLNGDDIILPNKITSARRYFRQHKECDVLVGNAFMTEIDFKPINHFIFSKEKLKFEFLLDYAKNHLIQPSVFFTRKAWDYYGILDINDHYAMDADLFISLARKFVFHHLNEDMAYSVYHEDCKTRGARAESIIALALVQAKHGGINEAGNTLQIMVNMFKELQKKYENGSLTTNDSKIAILEAKLNSIESLIQLKKESLLVANLEANQ